MFSDDRSDAIRDGRPASPGAVDSLVRWLCASDMLSSNESPMADSESLAERVSLTDS